MRLMISQPMKGKSEEQIRSERERVVDLLTREGHEVVDTIFAESPEEAQNRPLWYLAKSLDAMSKLDGVVFIGDWKSARGCRIEHAAAVEYGLFVREL